jgi:hypothetical protein
VCCSGMCESRGAFGPSCCNPVGAPCDAVNPGACCSLFCQRTDGSLSGFCVSGP